MERVRTISPYVPSRTLSPGAWAWLVQRVTSVVLLVAVPLKIVSGWAAVGKLGGAGLAALHGAAWLDTVILLALIFHTLYGLRVILIEHGLATRASWLFGLATGAGVVLFVASLWLVW